MIRLATRKSPLALWQANAVKDQLLHYYPDMQIELVSLVTAGDTRTDVQLTEIGGKSLFVKELQLALLDGAADIAVHSIKDMPAASTPGLTLAAVCQREDARDVLISRSVSRWQELPANAIIGTASPRRQCQLHYLRPDLIVKPLRGNVGTRLAKLHAGDFDAIILACAGIKRLGLASQISEYLSPHDFVPAIGQGAIGVECRIDDRQLQALLARINDWPTRLCISAERAVNMRLGGDCYTPVGAFAEIQDKELKLHAVVGSLDGRIILRAEKWGPSQDAQVIGREVAEQLLAQGAGKLCRRP